MSITNESIKILINKDTSGNLILETGNLGIGTSDPPSKLTIMSADSSNGNSDEFPFLSEYNSADERTDIFKRLDFMEKKNIVIVQNWQQVLNAYMGTIYIFKHILVGQVQILYLKLVIEIMVMRLNE